ncbi:thiamine phosphate synthase [Lichenihabitans sp. Uapishka_5]|uniref:thiamine phosphate synthase n=1 Tax=Lichenihabitans sp. Uapishka_5 TaxID=3037302 RepID=UPI0029E7DBF1|nr:thiamine phosphate synthase [Lichenihabitans sp. Uapishka_5]MDX7952999.1 thiamine phosphate synthase [Lichenihabitans sp. Uapishka_5]
MMAYQAIDPFYPVVPDAAWVARLVGAGARLIQLRHKGDDPALVAREIATALAACAGTGAQLVVNDHWQAAIEAGASYVHLGQEDLDGADLQALRRHGLKFGVSTHDHAELERGLSTDPDYVALGPVYPTTLKVMPWAPQGLERLGEWKRLVGSRPLVAIGGISLERVPGCLAAGADCVAVVSDIVAHPDPEARTGAWLLATQKVA